MQEPRRGPLHKAYKDNIDRAVQRVVDEGEHAESTDKLIAALVWTREELQRDHFDIKESVVKELRCIGDAIEDTRKRDRRRALKIGAGAGVGGGGILFALTEAVREFLRMWF